MKSLDASKRDPVFRIGVMIVALTLMTAAGFLLLYYKSELDVKQHAKEIGVIRDMLLQKSRLEQIEKNGR